MKNYELLMKKSLNFLLSDRGVAITAITLTFWISHYWLMLGFLWLLLVTLPGWTEVTLCHAQLEKLMCPKRRKMKIISLNFATFFHCKFTDINNYCSSCAYICNLKTALHKLSFSYIVILVIIRIKITKWCTKVWSIYEGVRKRDFQR